jgi:ABC-type antimicrobial peptide transport system permease subunit
MVVRNGLLLAAVGVALGLAAASGLTRFLSSFLFGVSPLDPVTYFAVSVGLLAGAAAASYIPAYRASRVNPVDALRAE